MKKQRLVEKRFADLSTVSIGSFFVTLALCSVLIVFTVINRSNVEKLTMEQLILEKSVKINEVISKLLYKTQTISALVIQNNGEITDFERTAATIIDDPAIKNILIAPGGVVSNVYPLYGNEAVIGLNFFEEGAGNKEANIAKETGELVFGGPFELVQGGQALVGRFPVYIESPDSGSSFWGLVSVTLQYPQALDGAGLALLEKQGFAFEIWRINPDDNEKQIIAHSEYSYNRHARYVERCISIFNAEWYCRIPPVRHWYEYPETWLLSLAGLFVSLLVAYVTQNNFELKRVKLELEELVRVDSLTEVFNRRYFMELAALQIEKALRSKGSCFIIMFDLDFYKQINDQYGHLAGDKVLKAVALRAKGLLRPYDLMARYGGEEFIILAVDVDKQSMLNMVERIRQGIFEAPIKYDHISIHVSASFGAAQAAPVNDIETAIKCADDALYKAKAEGRNKTVFYDEWNGK